MNILVTGGAGYIGGTVARLLLERGHSVVVYDNLCHGWRSMVPPGATFVEGDVAEGLDFDLSVVDVRIAHFELSVSGRTHPRGAEHEEAE